MKLSTRSREYIIPEYSLTGDLLSFLTCNLQYRYQNKGNLPPSMPVQLWFGEFIHGALEEAFLKWKKYSNTDQLAFPWDWEEEIKPIEDLITGRLKVKGLNPPYEYVNNYGPKDNIYSARLERSINLWGPHLFPLIEDTEVLIKGLRELKDENARSDYYSINGVVDVLSSKMVDKFYEGCDVVYGVRSDRETDTLFKKITAETFYKLLRGLGAEIVFNHADYRMLSYRMLCELSRYREVNLFLRGLVPLIGFKSGYVYYSRKKRIAGESHYPLKKMLSFAFDGITSLSIRPLHMIFGLGVVMSGLGMAGVVWTMIVAMTGKYRLGWDCIIYMLCFIGGMQLTCMGLLGEYIGKIYLEVKDRPRYIISDYTWEEGIHYNNQE